MYFQTQTVITSICIRFLPYLTYLTYTLHARITHTLHTHHTTHTTPHATCNFENVKFCLLNLLLFVL